MTRFLEIISVKEAREVIRRITPKPEPESVALNECYGRVLLEDIYPDMDIPGFSKSVVDGYAVISSDTAGAGEAIPAMLKYSGRIEMGQETDSLLNPGECMYVPTGAAIPDNADAVAMIEYCEDMGDQILIHKPLANGENIIFRGEDFSKEKIAIKSGTILRPQDCGVLAATGNEQLKVAKRPVIEIISTGNELVPVSKIPEGGQIRDVNSSLCESFMIKTGCIPKKYGIVRDEKETLLNALTKTKDECDAVLISGGSSKDERDNTAAAIEELGEVLVHGIAIAPGKPTIIGKAGDKPVIGLPGHPGSAFIVLFALVEDLLRGMQGTKPERVTRKARLAENIPSSIGREDYARVTLDREKDLAIPVFGKSGLLNTLRDSDGLVIVPTGSEGLEKDEIVEVILW